LYVSETKNSEFLDRELADAGETANWREWHTHLVRI